MSGHELERELGGCVVDWVLDERERITNNTRTSTGSTSDSTSPEPVASTSNAQHCHCNWCTGKPIRFNCSNGVVFYHPTQPRGEEGNAVENSQLCGGINEWCQCAPADNQEGFDHTVTGQPQEWYPHPEDTPSTSANYPNYCPAAEMPTVVSTAAEADTYENKMRKPLVCRLCRKAYKRNYYFTLHQSRCYATYKRRMQMMSNANGSWGGNPNG